MCKEFYEWCIGGSNVNIDFNCFEQNFILFKKEITSFDINYQHHYYDNNNNITSSDTVIDVFLKRVDYNSIDILKLYCIINFLASHGAKSANVSIQKQLISSLSLMRINILIVVKCCVEYDVFKIPDIYSEHLLNFFNEFKKYKAKYIESEQIISGIYNTNDISEIDKRFNCNKKIKDI